MTEQNMAALLRRFLKDPTQHAEKLRQNLPAVLRTLVTQPELVDEIDAAELDAVRLYDLLQGAPLADPQAKLIDQYTRLDAADDAKVRVAVEDLLLPLCNEEEMARAEMFDPLQIFQAAEAISTLMRRHVRRAKDFVRVLWRREGAMRVGDRLLPRDALTLEVARFAELFDDDDAPTTQARVLTELVWQMCRKQHNLLRHFRVSWATDEVLELDPVSLAERTDNLAERWAPISRVAAESWHGGESWHAADSSHGAASWHGTVIMRTSDRALAVAIKGSGPADDTLLSAIRDDLQSGREGGGSTSAALYAGRFMDVLDPWLQHDADTPTRFQLGDRQWDVVATAVVDDAELTDSGFDLIKEGTREHVDARRLADIGTKKDGKS